MLTCFSGPTHSVFQKILNHFVKKESVVLDITYGRGLSWKNAKKEYKVIKVDKRALFKDVIRADFNEFLRKKESGSVDCIYFDPPYYFKEKISGFDIKGQTFNNDKEVFWTEYEFFQALKTLQSEVPRVLKRNGFFIVKIMDGYIGKKYYPLGFEIFSKMSKVMEPKGIFICPINKKDNILQLIRTNFIYYLVFQNKL
jgi:DNA modification methylase